MELAFSPSEELEGDTRHPRAIGVGRFQVARTRGARRIHLETRRHRTDEGAHPIRDVGAGPLHAVERAGKYAAGNHGRGDDIKKFLAEPMVGIVDSAVFDHRGHVQFFQPRPDTTKRIEFQSQRKTGPFRTGRVYFIILVQSNRHSA